MKLMQKALIKKDAWSIISNKRLFPVLIIVPLMMTVVLPTIFVLAIQFSPEGSTDFQQMLELLPAAQQTGDIKQTLIKMILNSVIPIFFMIIPIMAASVMAASSFVGEKEKRTLETLLYCPLSLEQIFRAKILASFIISMAVTLISFVAMILVTEIELLLTTGVLFIPDISWAVVLLLISPAISLIAITLIVRGSAKAQTMEESQQRSSFLIMPIILLMAGQFSGIVLINGWLLLGLGVVLAIVAGILIKGALGRFTYEELLK